MNYPPQCRLMATLIIMGLSLMLPMGGAYSPAQENAANQVQSWSSDFNSTIASATLTVAANGPWTIVNASDATEERKFAIVLGFCQGAGNLTIGSASGDLGWIKTDYTAEVANGAEFEIIFARDSVLAGTPSAQCRIVGIALTVLYPNEDIEIKQIAGRLAGADPLFAESGTNDLINRFSNSPTAHLGNTYDPGNPPVAPVLFGNVSFRTAELSWTHPGSDNLLGFNLTRLASSGDIVTRTFPPTSFAFEERLPTAEQYQYNITAFNGNGTSVPSNNVILNATNRPIAGENGIIYGFPEAGLTARATLAQHFGVSENAVNLLLAIIIIVVASIGLANRFGKAAGMIGAFGGVALSYGLQLIPTWLIILLVAIATVPISLLPGRGN